MSEPKTRAEAIHEIAPRVRHWTIHDERLDFRSEAYALETDAGVVVLDPLPLTENAFEMLGQVAAIYLTGAFHQRSAWSFRKRLSVPVHAPAGAIGLEDTPDAYFEDGMRPAGGLVALRRSGPTEPHFVFRFDPAGGPSGLFCGDLLMRKGDGPFTFVPDRYQEDPVRTREGARTLLDPPVDLVCPAHGLPVLEHGTDRIREALES